MRHSAVALLALALLAAPLAAEAQQAIKAPINRIGVVWLCSLPLAPLSPSSPLFLLRQSLRGLGHIEGQNIAIESRFMGRRPITDQMAELVQLRVDVIVAMSTAAAWAAKNTTTTVPIVFSVVGDPVQLGLVSSLARPGGNLREPISCRRSKAGSAWRSSRRPCRR